jgi:hypothetical protein
MKTTQNTAKREREKFTYHKRQPVLIRGEQVKDPGKVAHVFNNFFLTITENVNIWKADAITFLKD